MKETDKQFEQEFVLKSFYDTCYELNKEHFDKDRLELIIEMTDKEDAKRFEVTKDNAFSSLTKILFDSENVNKVKSVKIISLMDKSEIFNLSIKK